jgi:hypothetical protein
MDHDGNRPSRARENLLAISLTIGVGGAIWFFLDLVTMGLMTGLLTGAALLAMVIAVHYLVWGRAFSDEVAAEREALRRQDEKPPMPPGAIQDIARTQAIKEK